MDLANIWKFYVNFNIHLILIM